MLFVGISVILTEEERDNMRKKIAFIGVGNMACAIINGITACRKINMSDIVLYDKFSSKPAEYAERGAVVVNSEAEAAALADCVFLCVKPQNFPDVLPCLTGVENVEKKLFVTIAAGIPMQTVEDACNGAPVIRALPNTPILVGAGVTAICKTDKVNNEDLELVCDIFRSSSSVLLIDESQMNKIIGVTSSSPAYVFLFIKSMYEGALVQGLVKSEDNPDGIEPDVIINSICDMLIGAATLMKSTDKTPDEQIKTVASKGGTTEQALLELERYSFSEGIVSAMQKCTKRADELGKS